jgi:cation diffusion facilitator CzcD-associated flavoprotein CzcO
LCALPNGDLFKAIRKGSAQVVTDHIDRFTSKGIKLVSGKELEADIIVTATGFNIQLIGGMQISINKKSIDMSQGMAYKGTMFEGVPNAGMIFGYTNSSWTLKSDISAEYLCRLFNHMNKIGAVKCTPVNKDNSLMREDFVTANSGAQKASYIQRAIKNMPKQGNKAPWKVYMNYLLDLPVLRYGKIDDGAMEFGFANKTSTQLVAEEAVA